MQNESFFFKWFDFPDLVQEQSSPTKKKTQGVGTGVTVKTKSVQVKEEIHVEPQQMLETTHVLLVKTATPLTYMELFLVLLLSSLIVKL